MSHSSQALVLHCIDFRFHTAIRDFLVSLGLKDQYDLVSLAGATKGLADDDPVGGPIIFKQIEISQKLHSIKEVYLINHLDCGAYGGHAAFADIEQEKAKHLQDLKIAATKIRENFPSLAVKKFLARIKETGGQPEVDFEAIN